MKSGSFINNYALFLGLFLLAGGIWGMFSNTIFAFMTTNINQAILFTVLGAAGVVLSISRRAYGYLLVAGALLAVAGVLFMIPATSHLMVQLLNMNGFVGVFSAVAGFLALMVANVGTRYVYSNH